jgi:hypothetical protein
MGELRLSSLLLSSVFVFLLIVALSASAVAQATESTIYSFNDTTDAGFPEAGVILDRSGNLYGATTEGGDLALCSGLGCGSVFKLAPNSDGSWEETLLYSFAGPPLDGASSYAPLVFDPQGNLYGTTYYGGSGPCNTGQFAGCGTVFELTRKPSGSWIETVIYNFQGGSDGAWPAAGVTLDAAGNLYGTTNVGGGGGSCTLGSVPSGCGTVFKLAHNSDGTWTESVVHQFQGGPDGAEPYGGLIFDKQGNLYGTTGSGGFYACRLGNKFTPEGCGTVFRLRLNSSGWTKTTVYNFKGGQDGQNPAWNLTFDSVGRLYGTTEFGGGLVLSFGYGTVFELTPNSQGAWSETVLYRFTGNGDGGLPFSGVTFDSVGNLYGVAFTGTIYELTPSSIGQWTETTIHTFTGKPDGSLPIGQLVRDQNGNFFGTTEWGGSGTGTMCQSQGCGIVFEVTP